MLPPDAPPYMKWDEEVARQLTDHNKRLQHLERLEDRGYTAGARVFNGAQILVPSGVVTPLTFDSERWDTDNIHSVVLNTDRLTCRTAGKYVAVGQTRWGVSNVGIRALYIRLNNLTDEVAGQDLFPTATDSPEFEVVTFVDMIVGDFIQLSVFHNAGFALAIRRTANRSPVFMMHRIG